MLIYIIFTDETLCLTHTPPASGSIYWNKTDHNLSSAEPNVAAAIDSTLIHNLSSLNRSSACAQHFHGTRNTEKASTVVGLLAK